MNTNHSTLGKVANLLSSVTSRRRFLSTAAGVAATSALAACGSSTAYMPKAGTSTAAASARLAAPAMEHSNMPGLDQKAPEPTPTSAAQAAAEMDQMHEAGVKAFPAKTQGQGLQPLAPVMDGDVKVFNLTTQKVMWEVEPGKLMEAWTYNGQLPGPEIRVTEGDKVRFVVKNELEESTAVHWHGVMVPNAMDGVPFITQPVIKAGQTFTYEFVAKNPGSHMYHSHHNSTRQVSMGLLGPFIIEPKDKSKDPKSDKEYIMVLNDSAHGYTLNGKSFPATQPLTAKKGQRVRVRYMNEGFQIHPMHLHGLPQLVFAKDGWNLPQPYMADTVLVAPGERYDVLIDCTEPGVWAYHCHILPHAESEHGMFGMVTALIVE